MSVLCGCQWVLASGHLPLSPVCAGLEKLSAAIGIHRWDSPESEIFTPCHTEAARGRRERALHVLELCQVGWFLGTFTYREKIAFGRTATGSTFRTEAKRKRERERERTTECSKSSVSSEGPFNDSTAKSRSLLLSSVESAQEPCASPFCSGRCRSLRRHAFPFEAIRFELEISSCPGVSGSWLLRPRRCLMIRKATHPAEIVRCCYWLWMNLWRFLRPCWRLLHSQLRPTVTKV